MDLILTEEEHQALPEERRTGTKRDDGTFLIGLDSDPIVATATAVQERDEAVTARDTAQDAARTAVDQQRGTARVLKTYTDIGEAEEFNRAKERIANLPPPKDPATAQLEERLAAMEKKASDAEAAAEKERRSAARERMVGKLRDVAANNGLRPDPLAMEALTLIVEQRGMAEGEDGSLLIGPEEQRRPAGEVIAGFAKDGASFLFGKSTGAGGEGGTGGGGDENDPYKRGASIRDDARKQWAG